MAESESASMAAGAMAGVTRARSGARWTRHASLATIEVTDEGEEAARHAYGHGQVLHVTRQLPRHRGVNTIVTTREGRRGGGDPGLESTRTRLHTRLHT